MKATYRPIPVVVALAIFTSSTTTVQAGDYLYETNNGTIMITGYTGPGGDVTIPSKIEGLPVTSIGPQAFRLGRSLTEVTIPDSVVAIESGFYEERFGAVFGAFAYCTSLTNVVFGNGVTSIGDFAFHGCTNLTHMAIGNSVASIGDFAFWYCTSLTSVTIGKSVTNIWWSTFDRCTSLNTITVPPDNPAYSSVDGVLFDKRQLALIKCPAGIPASQYAVPDGVTSIARGAFSDCRSLNNIITPSTVASIGFSAFFGCTSLTSVIIPNSVINIEAVAFEGCTNLTNVTIGNSVTWIGSGAFEGCSSLTGIYFEGDPPGGAETMFAQYHSGPLPATVYYLPGTTGWGTNYYKVPTALWVRPGPVILHNSASIQPNTFGFRISWATNVPVVVEASQSLTAPNWSAVSTNTLTDGWCDFRDPGWTNHQRRFYRVRSK